MRCAVFVTGFTSGLVLTRELIRTLCSLVPPCTEVLLVRTFDDGASGVSECLRRLVQHRPALRVRYLRNEPFRAAIAIGGGTAEFQKTIGHYPPVTWTVLNAPRGAPHGGWQWSPLARQFGTVTVDVRSPPRPFAQNAFVTATARPSMSPYDHAWCRPPPDVCRILGFCQPTYALLERVLVFFDENTRPVRGSLWV
jgi:hypothetical protein